jgi:hypothetical protein
MIPLDASLHETAREFIRKHGADAHDICRRWAQLSRDIGEFEAAQHWDRVASVVAGFSSLKER